MTNPMRVLVAMSGGVDSSVAAAMLREAGHDVTGVTLKLWGGESDSGCCSVSDVEDARRVAAQLDVPHYVFNFADDFTRAVVDPYVDAYVSGSTPNPCVECNRSIKFGRMFERAIALGFDAVATGHHAQVVFDADAGDDGEYQLRRGHDAAKDQSYVLYMLGQRELARTLFPVGSLTKADVRERAAALGLRTATKPESMDVCFIQRGQRTDFIAARASTPSGEVVDATGAVVGAHDGITGFTVGQRRGVGVAVGERRYVLDVDAPRARVTIGTRDELLREEIELRDLTFVGASRSGGALHAQMRAHGDPVPVSLRDHIVVFATPQPRVAPGQVVALYDGDALVAGGIAV
ncbi:MAG: tRNA 2-thiouridine(34) synthase MnmA [Acidimicrobiia bacterium]